MEENLAEEEATDVFSDVTPKVGNSSASNINQIVDVLKPHEVRWFYSSPKKTWIPFLGYDSYRIEIAYRQIHSSLKGLHTDTFDTISVRGDLYEVDVVNKKCSPIYWNGDNVDVMRGTWFFDVGWQPLDEEYASQIETEHLAKFAGWKMKDLESPLEPCKNHDGEIQNDIRSISPILTNQKNKTSLPTNKLLPELDSKLAHKGLNSNFSYISTSLSQENIANERLLDETSLKKTPNGFLPSPNLATLVPDENFKASSHPTTPTLTKRATVDGGKSSPIEELGPSNKIKEAVPPSNKATNNSNNKKKAAYANPLHNLKFKDFFVEWYNPGEVYMFSQATSSKLYRSLTYALGFQKMGLRLNRGYCIMANDTDKPPVIKHLVFVIHGIGAKLDASKCIRNCGLLRDHASRIKQKCFTDKSVVDCRAEFLPIEWRANLKLDDGAVDMISPKNVIGLRSILNTTVMDIMYYTSPIFRNEILNGVQKELNRLYQMFCDRHPNFPKDPQNKVSVIAHSLGTVIIHDILTGWNPSYIHQNYVDQTLNECFEGLNEEESQKLSKFADNIRANVIDIEKKLHLIRKTRSSLKFQVENLFLLGSPLAVFLVMRGISIYGRGVNSITATNSSGNSSPAPKSQFNMAPAPIGSSSSSSSSTKTGDDDYDNITHILSRNARARHRSREHSSVPHIDKKVSSAEPTESLQRELEKIDKKKPPPRPPPLSTTKSVSNHATTPHLSSTGDTPYKDENNDVDHHQHRSPSFDKPKISVLLPRHICNKIYNIYHPADPVAYRLEPLISYKYINIKPVSIHRYDQSKKTPYSQMQPELYPEVVDPAPLGAGALNARAAVSTLEPKTGVSSGEEAISALTENAASVEEGGAASNFSYYDYRAYYPKLLMSAAYKDVDCLKTGTENALASSAVVTSDSEKDLQEAFKDSQASGSTQVSGAPRSSWTPNLDFIKTYWRRGDSLNDQTALKSTSKNDLSAEKNAITDSGPLASSTTVKNSSGQNVGDENLAKPDSGNSSSAGPRFKIQYHHRPHKRISATRKRSDLRDMQEKRIASPGQTSDETDAEETVDFMIEDARYNCPTDEQSSQMAEVVISTEQKVIFPLTTPISNTNISNSSSSKPQNNDGKGNGPKSSLHSSPTSKSSGGAKDGDIPVLEYRVDYSLPSGWTIVNTYVSAITAHTSYWSNPDVIYFILQHLYNSNL